MSFTISWTPEEDGILRDLWQRGLSAAEIGRQLGRSKNSIIGRSHRQCLTARPSPIRPAGQKPERITGRTLPSLPSLAQPAWNAVPPPSLATRMLVAKLLTDGRSNEAVSEDANISVHEVRKIRKGMPIPKRRVRDSDYDSRSHKKMGEEIPKVFAATGLEFRKSYRNVSRWINGSRFQFGKQLERRAAENLPTSDDIAAFIAQHGVTKLPAAAAAITTAKISDQDRMAIATYQAARNEEHYAKHAQRNKRGTEAAARLAARRR